MKKIYQYKMFSAKHFILQDKKTPQVNNIIESILL